jgi:3-hydroxyisobutyrate dehydrogenase-like beta-hydroxyacid dehydrogenase
MRIGFLGYGEAGRAFHEGLSGPEVSVIAHDRLLQGKPSHEMRRAMTERGAEIAPHPSDLASADWIFSAVTADQSLEAIATLAPHLRPGQLVIDINSVSPERKRATASLVTAQSATYLDMAVMAPVHPRRHATPVLIAGPQAEALLPRLTALGFNAEIAGTQVGAATAIKMVRSLFVKGLEALTVETLLAAEASGCFDYVLASLTASYPGLGWPDFAGYQFERTLRHGQRRAAEMRESAETVAALGLQGTFADEIADVQAQMGRCGLGAETGLHTVVKATLRRRRSETRATSGHPLGALDEKPTLLPG